MNIDEYEKREPIYRAFAKAVECELNTAFKDVDKTPKPMVIQSRAKEVNSLRGKLKKYNIVDTDTIETEIKDLAGVRIVFYTNTDVNRFLNSRFINNKFEVGEENPKIHHPNPENEGDLYEAIHYVIRFTPAMLTRDEYSEFTELRCEIQIQTMLSHVWAEVSHDILYKKPEMKSFGNDAFQAIEKRMQKIAKQYLGPANHEFDKVQNDFERLMQGKKLFDRDVLDALAQSSDNNARYDILSTIKEYVLPHYDDIESIYPELARALCDVVHAARQTAPQPIPSEFGDIQSYDAEQIIKFAVDIFTELRYVDVEITFHSLVEIFRDEADKGVRKCIFEAVEQLARYDIDIWQQAGPHVQFLLTELARKLLSADSVALKKIARIIWREALGNEMRGTSFTDETCILRTGTVGVSNELKAIRRKAIDGLISLFDQAELLAEKKDIISDLKKKISAPSLEHASNELYAVMIADAEYIINLLTERVSGKPYEFLQCIESLMMTLYQRARRIAYGDRFGCKGGAENLCRAIEALRDHIDSDIFFVRYKTLVGFERVFSQNWEDDNYDYKNDKAYRRQQSLEYIAEISTRNENEWHDFVARCAATESNDGGTFPIFCDFLRGLAKEKPDIVLGWLANADAHLLKFLPHILNGLSDSNATADYDSLIAGYLGQGNYLAAIAKHFQSLKILPVEQAKALFDKALTNDDRQAIFITVALAIEKHESAPDWAEAVFVSALQHLVTAKDYCWIYQIQFISNLESFVAQLSPDRIRLALDSLLSAPEIDSKIERFFTLIATRHPKAIWLFFKQRLDYGEGIKGYETFPYRFNALVEPLSADPDLAIDMVRSWYRPDQYKGGRLLCAVLPVFSDVVAKKFTEIAERGTEQDLDFILDTLRNYHGNTAIFPVLMTVVNQLPPDDTIRLENIKRCIMAYGVLRGPFGCVAEYQAKKKALQFWIDDARSPVKNFVAERIQHLDSCIALEQRRAEHQVEQRRLAFDNP